MKTIKEITIEDVQDTFAGDILSRGEEYFEEDYVTFFEIIDSNTIRGTVSGNQDYDVSVSIDEDGDLLCDCSCPCDFNCKHAAALLLYWLEEKEKDGGSDLKEAKRQTVDGVLQKKSKQELIILLKEIFEKHRELEVLVKINKAEVKAKIQNLFSRFWEWNEVRNLIEQLELVLEGIQKNITSVDENLFEEMLESTEIIVEGQNNVHGEDEISIFLDDWLKVLGEVFSRTKPTKKKKIVFITKMLEFQKKDDYGLEDCFNNALIGMCKTKEDITLIKENFLSQKSSEDEDWKRWEEETVQEFLLELYEQIGADKDYLDLAEKEGFSEHFVDKLISLGKLQEALKVCVKAMSKDYYHFANKEIEILGTLGKKGELKKALFKLVLHGNHQWDLKKLKRECSKEEWKKYSARIIADAKKKNRESFLSRLYYDECDYQKAYEYSKSLRDDNYLELLAKKLGEEHPLLACQIYKKLCFSWINSGSGFCYKKAGEILKTVKRLDESGSFFRKVKEEIILKYKKRWSLMKIVERI